ncbi:hypothetical protein 33D_0035 [Mycobacterium phage 33D]|nr:hypothetical protein 33D_0035 [Mycobacterium phage 33D]
MTTDLAAGDATGADLLGEPPLGAGDTSRDVGDGIGQQGAGHSSTVAPNCSVFCTDRRGAVFCTFWFRRGAGSATRSSRDTPNSPATCANTLVVATPDQSASNAAYIVLLGMLTRLARAVRSRIPRRASVFETLPGFHRSSCRGAVMAVTIAHLSRICTIGRDLLHARTISVSHNRCSSLLFSPET